jgi:hypothetical protein
MIQLYNTALARSTNFPYSSVSPSRTQPGPPRHAVLVHGVQLPVNFLIHLPQLKKISSVFFQNYIVPVQYARDSIFLIFLTYHSYRLKTPGNFTNGRLAVKQANKRRPHF